MYTQRILLSILGVALLLTASAGALVQVAAPGQQMTSAARDFLAMLQDDQREKALLPYETPARVDWHFIPKDSRKGLQVKEMNQEQRQAAHQLLRAALSEIGYTKAVRVMALEALLAELEKNRQGGPLRDAERYYFTVFGEPQAQGRWGLSVEGHHLSLNFVVENGRVASTTPTFYGANPAIVKTEVPTGIEGIQQGTRVLDKEEVLAFQLLDSLDQRQREAAILADEAPREIRAAGEPQPPQSAPEGIALEKLNKQQSELLKQLIAAYAANVPEKIANERMQAFEAAAPGEVFFAWAGPLEPGVGHYYRVQGPTFLIEFINNQPDSAGNPANHIHCVWRDLRGDFAVQQ